MRTKIRLTALEGVSPGGRAVLRVPVGPRYHGMNIFVSGLVGATGTTPAVNASQIVSSVRLLVNGVEQRNLSTSQYQAIARLNGVTVSNLVIPVFFSERWRATATQEEMTSWDTSSSKTFTVEFELNSVVPAGLAGAGTNVVSPAITVFAEYDNVRNVDNEGKPFSVIVKQLRRTVNVPAGEFDITTLPTNFPISRLYLTNSAGTISDVQLFADEVIVREGTKAQNDEMLAQYGLDGSQFGYAIVPDYEQQLSSPLRATVLNVRATFTNPGSCTTIIEQITPGF